MRRGFFDAFVLFLLPFLAYAGMLVLRRRYPFLAAHWTGRRVALLTVAGLGLATLGLLLYGLFAPRHLGIYKPAHVEDGRLVPGRIE